MGHDEPITEQLTTYSLGTTFEELPLEVVDHAKRIILDTLGCMVLGSTMVSGELMRDHVLSMQGLGESIIIGGGDRAPVPLAALANGTSGHADELDASHSSWGHPAVSAVAGPLAICEVNRLGGKELINAVVLAHDIGCRLLTAFGGRAALLNTHHSHSSVLNALGVTASVGRLVSLDPAKLHHAFALTASNIFAVAAFMDERNHMTKAMNHGQASFAGISGVLLASRGFEGNDNIFEAEHGLIDVWRTDKADLSKITQGLGTEYSVMGTGFKYYSAGYPIHAPLWGALQLMKAHGIAVSDIESVRIGMGSQSAEIVDSRDNASICIQDMVSLGMVLGRLSYDDAHDETGLQREDVKDLRGKLAIVRDADIDQRSPESRAAWVEIDTTAGETHRAPEQFPPGHWERGGMPFEDVEEKFALLVEPRKGEKVTEGVIDFVRDLESKDGLDELVELLIG